MPMTRQVTRQKKIFPIRKNVSICRKNTRFQRPTDPQTPTAHEADEVPHVQSLPKKWLYRSGGIRPPADLSLKGETTICESAIPQPIARGGPRQPRVTSQHHEPVSGHGCPFACCAPCPSCSPGLIRIETSLAWPPMPSESGQSYSG